jgi:DNA-binding XRE family transcriptional regulator
MEEGPLLTTYFKTCRLKAGLTQKDIAFLLALRYQTVISRVEKNIQKPPLKIVFAYSLVFGIEIKKLLPLLLSDINKLIINRASLLVKYLERQKSTPLIRRRIEFLTGLNAHKK